MQSQHLIGQLVELTQAQLVLPEEGLKALRLPAGTRGTVEAFDVFCVFPDFSLRWGATIHVHNPEFSGGFTGEVTVPLESLRLV